MADTTKRFWYLARCRTNGLVSYLVSAISLQAAEDTFGCLQANYEFKELTYDDVDRLFGMGKPINSKGTDIACGDILMQIHNAGVVLRIAE